jgi:3D (Asp-Asp-Asp) domain-containing protein
VQAQLCRLWAVLAVGLVAGAVLLPSAAGADSGRRGEPHREVGAVQPEARGARRISVQASGYALKGTTATGIPVGWGIVAVDPNVIPLGTPMTIPGYGRGVAADIGSSVRGAQIDLWFSTRAQALAWGRRTVTITLH